MTFAPDQILPPDRNALKIAVAFLAAITLTVLLVGYWYIRVEREEITSGKCQALAAIGDLKSKQIQQWRKERIFEVERAVRQPDLLRTVENILANPGDEAFKADLGRSLKLEMISGEHSDTLLFDPEARLLYSSSKNPNPLSAATREAVRSAVGGQGAVFSDFFRSSDGTVYIDSAAAFRDDRNRSVAVLVLRSDATDYLYPLIQSWPMPSQSGETLLVRREGDSVLFLNELRHERNTALSLRIPLTRVDVPAVQAVKGKEGIFEGNDYRGTRVLSHLQPVPGFPWFMVAKIDRKEILADMNYRAGMVTLIVALIILLAAALIAHLYRQRQAEISRNRIIAERNQAEREREQFFKFFMLSTEPMCIADPFGRFHKVNPAFSSLTGYPESELVSRPFLEFVLPEDRLKTTAEMELQVKHRPSMNFENRYVRRDSSVVLLSWTAFFDGNDRVTYATARDITERREAEQKIARHSLALEEANDRLTKSIRRAEGLAVQAQASTRAKSEFLAVMSHELRTPLNGVLGFAELLSGTSIDDEQKEFVRMITESGSHLLDIVNDILDFSDMERGGIAIEPAPAAIAPIVELSCISPRKAAADKGLQFCCETAPGVPEQIVCDARRIRQILIHLLGNAVKFTEAGSVILRIAPSSSEGRSYLDFSVEDTGSGVCTEQLGHLFDPFTQADSTLHRQFGGTGLGLAISQKLAAAMGGHISVVSDSDKGSTFTFRFPLSSHPADGCSAGNPSAS